MQEREKEADPAEVRRIATALALPEGCLLSPHALTIPPGTTEEALCAALERLLALETWLPWACGDLSLFADEHRFSDVAGVFRRLGVTATRLAHLRQTARRIPPALRYLPLTHTHYLAVATGLGGYPLKRHARTAAGEQEAAAWRERAIAILGDAHAQGMSASELRRHLAELQGKVAPLGGGMLSQVSWQLLEKVRDHLAARGELAPGDAVTEELGRLHRLLLECVVAAEGCLGMRRRNAARRQAAMLSAAAALILVVLGTAFVVDRRNLSQAKPGAVSASVPVLAPRTAELPRTESRVPPPRRPIAAPPSRRPTVKAREAARTLPPVHFDLVDRRRASPSEDDIVIDLTGLPMMTVPVRR